MKYAKSYIDKLFSTINEYHSKVELFRIAYSEFEENKDDSLEWIIELSEVINWQAMYDRSGVWTYYEVLDNEFAQILIKGLRVRNEVEILNKYVTGIDNYSNEALMDEIDKWIRKKKTKIYIYIESILVEFKDWFYNTLK